MVSASMEMSAGAASRAETPHARLDEDLVVLRDHAREFARLPASQRASLLRECLPGIARVARPWVEAATRAKGLAMDTPASSEEWLGGPITTARNARLLARSLDQIAVEGRPSLPPKRFSRSADDRTVVDVFPSDGIDAALFTGFSCGVRMLPGVSERETRERQAGFYSQRDPEGGVSLVLGAGNVASIPPMDALYKMFVEGHACVVKMNPVNEYLAPFFEQAFEPLIRRGYLRFVCGGADVGTHLVQHAAVTDVHVTGSDRTHDLLVWGPPGPDRTKRMETDDPLLKKPITSELGSVTPVVIVPANFSDRELQFVAENVATMVVNNASCNCNAAKMLVLSRGWHQRTDFLERVRTIIGAAGARRAYYPGARDRYDALLKGRDGVATSGRAQEGELPWAFVFGLDPASRDEALFTTEPFTAILSETSLPGSAPAAFIAAATAFCNDRLWGTLSATIIAHPSIQRDPGAAAALETAIADLRYGAVAINHWPGIVYGTVTPPWGAHPSSTPRDIRGGLGWVHNTFMLDGIEKAVLRGPLTMFPKPPWFVTHRNAHRVSTRMLEAEIAPSWLKVPGVALAALRG